MRVSVAAAIGQFDYAVAHVHVDSPRTSFASEDPRVVVPFGADNRCGRVRRRDAVDVTARRPAGHSPSLANGDWPSYAGDLAITTIRRSRRSPRSNFNALEVAWRFKTDSLGPRPEFKLEGTPLMVEGRAVHDRRHAPRGRRARRRDRRAAVGPRRARRRARAAAPAPAVGPRRRLLDRRPRRTDSLRHDRLSAGRARRENRRAHRLLRQRRHRRSEGSGGVRQSASRSISITGEIGVHSTPAITRRRRRPHRVVDSAKAARRRRTTTPRGSSRPSTCAPASGCGRSTRFRGPANSATTRG